MRRFLILAVAAALSPACLVLNIQPLYDNETLKWEPDLVGSWHDAEDKASIHVEKAEWNSYAIRYQHPTESGEATGHLTAVGGDSYLDVMATRGQDRGAFLVPVHIILRVQLQGDRLELTPLSYDWLADQLRGRQRIAGLEVAFDERQNTLIVSPTDRLRGWLRSQPRTGPVFGAAATFTRAPAAAPRGRN